METEEANIPVVTDETRVFRGEIRRTTEPLFGGVCEIQRMDAAERRFDGPPTESVGACTSPPGNDAATRSFATPDYHCPLGQTSWVRDRHDIWYLPSGHPPTFRASGIEKSERRVSHVPPGRFADGGREGSIADAPSDRCGYQLEIGQVEEEFSAAPCDRPAWEDHDHCIWHAKVDGKPIDVLEETQPESKEDLNGAHLKGAILVGVDWFADTSLVGADLRDADLTGADFSEANMMLAKLTNVSGIDADVTGTNLEGAILTNADLRRATLEDALLNEAVLTNVHIGAGTNLGTNSAYERESVQPTLSDVHRLEAAAWAYRQLEQLYEENAHPVLAQRSYNQEKDARRRLAWDEGDYAGAIKWSLSRWVVQYGSSPYRVLLVSLLVIVVSALLYPLTGGIQEVQNGQTIPYAIEDPVGASIGWLGTVLFKSFYFSVVTFGTLGYGDIQPIGVSARVLAGVETILGSLLAALLVFVLARIVTW